MIDYECLGSLYLGVSTDFQRGLLPIARTVKAEQHDLGIFLLNVREGKSLNKVLQIGNFVDTGNFDNPQRGRVYDIGGVAPTINTCQGGGLQPHILVFKDSEKERDMTNTVILDQQGRTEKKIIPHDICTTLREESHGNQPIVIAMRGRPDNAVLTPKRTEYGKEIRKAYENHEVSEQRHNMQRLEPRTDGLSNTITTVQKDNLLLEWKENISEYREDILDWLMENAEVRRLSPRECLRLMDVSDDDIDKILDTVSSSQAYKQAGNSIVVSVMEHMFRKLNIQQDKVD